MRHFAKDFSEVLVCYGYVMLWNYIKKGGKASLTQFVCGKPTLAPVNCGMPIQILTNMLLNNQFF